MIIFVMLLLIVFRGSIYRSVIKYKPIQKRTIKFVSNGNLKNKIKATFDESDFNLYEINREALNLTTKTLSFTFGKASRDPNVLMNTKKGNCVSYAAMYASIVQEIILKNKLQNDFAVTHEVAKLKFLGLDIHALFSSSFFKDHDFNILENLKTGEKIYIDPSISDCLWIQNIAVD